MSGGRFDPPAEVERACDQARRDGFLAAQLVDDTGRPEVAAALRRLAEGSFTTLAAWLPLRAIGDVATLYAYAYADDAGVETRLMSDAADYQYAEFYHNVEEAFVAGVGGDVLLRLRVVVEAVEVGPQQLEAVGDAQDVVQGGRNQASRIHDEWFLSKYGYGNDGECVGV